MAKRAPPVPPKAMLVELKSVLTGLLANAPDPLGGEAVSKLAAALDFNHDALEPALVTVFQSQRRAMEQEEKKRKEKKKEKKKRKEKKRKGMIVCFSDF